MKLRLLVPGLALALAASPAAHAGGFYSALFGGEQGNPITDDATAVYFNPAGLSLSSGTRLQLNGVFGYRQLGYDRPAGAIDHVVPAGSTGGGTPADAVSANAGKASALNAQVLPFIALVTDLGVKNLAVAAAFYVPFGGLASWNKNASYAGSTLYPGAVDSPARWGLIDGDIRSYYATLAASYTIEKAHLSLGVSGNLIYDTIGVLRARTATGSDDLVSSTGDVVEGRSQISVSNVTGSIGAGVIWQPERRWWIGVAYQSQPNFGRETLTGTLRNRFGASAVTEQKVDFQQSLPDILRGGVRVRPIPVVELRFYGDWQRWSVLDKQCVLDQTDPKRNCKTLPTGAVDTSGGGSGILLVIPRQWKDGYSLHLSASWNVRPWVELTVGAGYDANVVPDATADPSIIDQDKVLAALGARFWVAKRRLLIGTTWTQVFFVPRTVPVAARDGSGGRVTLQAPSRSPDGGGRYTQSVGLFSLVLEYRFR